MRISDWSSDVCSSDLFRHAPSLIAGAVQFRLAGLAATIAISDRGRAIGRSTPYFIHAGLACIAIVQTDNGHAEMQQIGDDGKLRCFLPAMLRRAGTDRKSTSELQSLMRISYAVFCLTNKTTHILRT